jgi:hypothetical protein
VALGSCEELLCQNPGCCDLEDLFLHLTGKKLRD